MWGVGVGYGHWEEDEEEVGNCKRGSRVPTELAVHKLSCSIISTQNRTSNPDILTSSIGGVDRVLTPFSGLPRCNRCIHDISGERKYIGFMRLVGDFNHVLARRCSSRVLLVILIGNTDYDKIDRRRNKGLECALKSENVISRQYFFAV